MSAPDYRDLVIETLALSEAELLERVVHLTETCTSYRELAQEALHAVAHLTTERGRHRTRLQHLQEELRRLRKVAA